MFNNTEKNVCALVKWLDSSTVSGWIAEDYEALPKEIVSFGMVHRMTEDAVILISSKSNTGGILSPLIIPLCCITAIETFETEFQPRPLEVQPQEPRALLQ